MFYANIIVMNGSIFLPTPQIHVFVRIVVNWMSLRYGFDTCVYDGMDSYAKAWMNFLFPVYLFVIVGLIITMSKVSKRLAKLLPGNIVRVMATLFILSYTRLIYSVVVPLSFSMIRYTKVNQERRVVWMPDPNIEFFSGKHIPLGLVAIVFGLLIVAYMLVLLFVQPLQRYSHTSAASRGWPNSSLSSMPTLPHTSSKTTCRYWEGLLLLFRLILALVSATNSCQHCQPPT